MRRRINRDYGGETGQPRGNRAGDKRATPHCFAYGVSLIRWRRGPHRSVRPQQITGTSGPSDATTTIDGHYLPPPQPFKGQIAAISPIYVACASVKLTQAPARCSGTTGRYRNAVTCAAARYRGCPRSRVFNCNAPRRHWWRRAQPAKKSSTKLASSAGFSISGMWPQFSMRTSRERGMARR
jgi:hypothetical protein